MYFKKLCFFWNSPVCNRMSQILLSSDNVLNFRLFFTGKEIMHYSLVPIVANFTARTMHSIKLIFPGSLVSEGTDIFYISRVNLGPNILFVISIIVSKCFWFWSCLPVVCVSVRALIHVNILGLSCYATAIYCDIFSIEKMMCNIHNSFTGTLKIAF